MLRTRSRGSDRPLSKTNKRRDDSVTRKRVYQLGNGRTRYDKQSAYLRPRTVLLRRRPFSNSVGDRKYVRARKTRYTNDTKCVRKQCDRRRSFSCVVIPRATADETATGRRTALLPKRARYQCDATCTARATFPLICRPRYLLSSFRLTHVNTPLSSRRRPVKYDFLLCIFFFTFSRV